MADKEKEVKDKQEKVEKVETASVPIDQLATMVASIVEAMKRDPEKEAAKEQAAERRKQMQQQQKDMEAGQVAVRKACSHQRENGSWAIAWMGYADNIPRGVCQKCQDLFDPKHPDYATLIKVSTSGYTLTLKA